MRVLPVALAVSAALHTAAIAYVRTRPVAKPVAKQLVTIETIQVLPPEPPPTEVALLDDHTVATPGVEASPSRPTTKDRRRVVTTSRAVVETPPPVKIDTPPPKRSSLMTMRHPKIETGPSSDFVTRFLDRSGPPIIDQSAAGISERLNNPNWVANATPDELTAERVKLMQRREEVANAELKPDGAGTKSEHQTFRVKVNPDGTVKSIKDKANWQQKSVLSAEFDVSDMMMRRQGIDPYASYKLKVLDETRDQRVEIGKRYRTQQLAQSRQHMQKNLARLVATARDVAALKQGVFELWDDCAETGSDELVVAGRAAREYVIGFVRSRLPKDGADAFTVAELARFNKQRKSQAIFAPYE